ncbi:MAG: phytanoyl-CoA dioxygenase family protein [Bdellovibrionales bacterium]|nr:phytanoyl-CoA dioxygenase family protein [Bdellovibrionales bacterium]
MALLKMQYDLYPTRGNHEEKYKRLDPIIHGNDFQKTEYSLSNQQLNFFKINGYLTVENVFSESEINQLLSEFKKLRFNSALKNREEFILEPETQHVRSIFNPHNFSYTFNNISKDKRIVHPVQQILNSRVYIPHARINIKPAMGGKSFNWHSDFETWHAEDGIPHMRLVTAWVMLTENNEFNGSLFVIPKSHNQFISCIGRTPLNNYKSSLRKQKFGVPSVDLIKEAASKGGLKAIYGKPGTLVFHECNLLHGSPDNMSPWPRTNLMFVYNSIYNTPNKYPYAADEFRPEFLSSKKYTPIKPK